MDGKEVLAMGDGGEWRKWTARRTDLELRMGPHTRFHLRIDAFRASNTSSTSGKSGGGVKASHLRWGAWRLTKVSKNLEDNIAKAIRFS